MDLGTTLSLLVTLLVGVAIGTGVGWLLARTRATGHDAAIARREIESRAADHAVVREGLDRLHDRMRDLEHHRVSWQSQLKQQVDEMRLSTESLRRETSTLTTALRRPQVRGRWGELHLRRAVELAGLVARCDFDEQVSVRHDPSTGSGHGEAALRPDMVVHLAGGKQVVVDAKVPLDAFLDATSADDEEEHLAHLRRHARQLRQHVDTLGGKAYWRGLRATPEFVVLFVPGESFLSAALEADPTLIEHAASRQVVLATPTTLIALLRTIAHAWTQEVLADRVHDIHVLGRELHERLATMGDHLDKVGRGLTAAVAAYNRAIGSLESRVLVSARRFTDLEVTPDALPAPEPVTDAPRQLSAAELLDAVAEPRPELPDAADEGPRGDSTPRRTA
ncbi:DNA recombination protein RmuC [Nocardioides iriomotensis]|uniref:DNA recombination protein RmuC n=1 Tax=Nocardioides iriomotensis TaxID=715784 RepID=A0A4Q5J8E8_9ACTN|nr:DNA recombination protein RmuC [Nocardioides iriomotensis]RYU14188.1 DNA recombination protein RmuC [Nocardioides iriomotensis]